MKSFFIVRLTKQRSARKLLAPPFSRGAVGRRSQPVLTPRQPPLHVALSAGSERWRHSHLSSRVESGCASTLGARSGVKTVVGRCERKAVCSEAEKLEARSCDWNEFSARHTRSAECCSIGEPWYNTSQSAPARVTRALGAARWWHPCTGPTRLVLFCPALVRRVRKRKPEREKWHLVLASHRAATVHNCAALAACA
ncbi:hypothetical protein L1887_59922 [Cichorium endivia]|nr:hypothetical protein L1887_59922 [Cichorium endivia]